MNAHRQAALGIIPPFMVERMMQSPDEQVRKLAAENLAASSEARTMRYTLAFAPTLLAMAAPAGGKYRLVYDAKSDWRLPGDLVRSEGQPPTGDGAADEAYDNTGHTYGFFREVFGRNSLDDNGLALRSSVHYRPNYCNAFWNGAQMVFGDGDGKVFVRFTRSLTVVAHELAHGVISFGPNFIYQDEPGALHEHFADVLGVLARQWRTKQSAEEASWLVGDELIVPAPTRRAIRDMSAPGTAYRGDPHLGDDPQPAHVKDQYRGSADYGGVHINSGIPNLAFCTAAKEIGGHAWKKAGLVWYKAMLKLTEKSGFLDACQTTYEAAGSLFPDDLAVQRAVKKGWQTVGVWA